MYLIIRILINVAAILIIAHIFPKLIQVEGFGGPYCRVGPGNHQCDYPADPGLAYLSSDLARLSGSSCSSLTRSCLWLAATIVPGFKVNGFWGAFLGSILISIVSWVFSAVLPGK